MGEAVNLVENFKVEKVIFNCGEFYYISGEILEKLKKFDIQMHSLNLQETKKNKIL